MDSKNENKKINLPNKQLSVSELAVSLNALAQ